MRIEDYTKNYFDYKVSRMVAVTLCLIGLGAFSAVVACYYLDRNAPKTDNEYTVQLKYLEMGYVQRTCGKCTMPAWLKVDATIHCEIDGVSCGPK